jgi:hypothetical protein
MKDKYCYNKPNTFRCVNCGSLYQAYAKHSLKCYHCNTSTCSPEYAHVHITCERCKHKQIIRSAVKGNQWCCSVCMFKGLL